MNVKILKLIGNTELICEILRQKEDSCVVIRRPLVVLPMRGQNGEVYIDYALWSMVTDPEQMIYLNSSNLVCEPLDPTPAAAQYYIQRVTGIEVPSTATGTILHG